MSGTHNDDHRDPDDRTHAGAGGTSNGHPNGGELLLLTEDILDGERARLVAEHLLSCDGCRRAQQRLSGLVRALREAGTVRLRTRSVPCPDEEELAAYADGALGDADRQAVEAHLAVCNACLGEIADLWALEGPEESDAPQYSVERILKRLGSEPKPALVRWADRTLEVIRDYAGSIRALEAPELPPRAVPSLAVSGARGAGSEVGLRWSEGRLRVDGTLELTPEGPALSGAVTVAGEPAATVSVMLTTETTSRGPESLDTSGRFGPWALSAGSNVLHLTGVPGRDGDPLELEIVVNEADDATNLPH